MLTKKFLCSSRILHPSLGDELITLLGTGVVGGGLSGLGWGQAPDAQISFILNFQNEQQSIVY